MNKNCWTTRDYLRLGLCGFPKRGLFGIDVTYRCNLNCTHCYFKHQGHNSELSLHEWEDLLRATRNSGQAMLICGWLGGEPLLRPEIIDMGRMFFKSNVVFTNGTREIPRWEDCTFVVSVPGGRSLYQAATGTDEGHYDMVKKHADRSDVRVIVSYCVTRENAGSITDFIEEWQRDTAVSGIFFEFYTPTKRETNGLWLDWQGRDEVLNTLIALKKTYGRFIYNNLPMLRAMKAASIRKILSRCPFSEIGLSLDPMGRRKRPCTLGPQADCGRCGCILPVLSRILRRKPTLLWAFVEGVWSHFRGRYSPERTLKQAPRPASR